MKSAINKLTEMSSRRYTLKSLSIPSLPGRPMSVQVLSSGTGAQQQGFGGGGGGGGGARQRLGSRPSG